jgi:hypothetical protein
VWQQAGQGEQSEGQIACPPADKTHRMPKVLAGFGRAWLDDLGFHGRPRTGIEGGSLKGPKSTI